MSSRGSTPQTVALAAAIAAIFEHLRKKSTVPRYVTELKEELDKSQALYDLLSQNIPEELRFFMQRVADDVNRGRKEVERATAEFVGSTFLTRWLTTAQPVVKAMAPALTFWAAFELSIFEMAFILFAFYLFIRLCLWWDKNVVEKLHDIWSGQEEKNFDRMRRSLERTNGEILQFRFLESRSSNPADPHRMLEHHPEAVRFWQNHFGSKMTSVSALRLTNLLLDAVERPPKENLDLGKDDIKKLVVDTIIKLMDLDHDGEVNTDDFKNFLTLWGPFDQVCRNVCDSLLEQKPEASKTDPDNLRVVPWFSFSTKPVKITVEDDQWRYLVRLSYPASLALEIFGFEKGAQAPQRKMKVNLSLGLC